ncbi:hypothetical protein SGRA_0822 [Saprospira grandis str. Lewin]|uniref:Uncharacterized protein n=1 Tax=Saprospira grandis (strain Lewin) TaxID=984262 RepID=H6L222_SAPGL|nr:hypothetical protein SGRA_0822 [Saprospira grandis str. Lewin]
MVNLQNKLFADKLHFPHFLFVGNLPKPRQKKATPKKGVA